MAWLRVRDPETGHEYDLHESAMIDPGLVVLEDYPPNNTDVARPAKHRTDLAGQSVTGTSADGQPPSDNDPASAGENTDPDPAAAGEGNSSQEG